MHTVVVIAIIIASARVIRYFTQRLRRLVNPSDKWKSSVIRYGESDAINGASEEYVNGTDNTAYLKSTASLDNKQYESGL